MGVIVRVGEGVRVEVGVLVEVGILVGTGVDVETVLVVVDDCVLQPQVPVYDLYP